MIWSKHDFEREVRRQLVELASIRKRVPQDPDVLARIGKLEESHKHLLRKLEEILPGSEAKEAARSKRRRGAGRPSALLSKYLRTVERSARAFDAVLSNASGGRKPPRRRAAARARKELPSLGVKCAACGKVLFSGVLGGDEVVSSGSAWYHRACAGEGDGFSKRSLLN